MPLTIVQIVLGASFVLIWVFIGAMIFRDRKFAIRDEQETAAFSAHSQHAMPPRPHADFGQKDVARSPRRPSAA
jgi:hypothetical protein